MKDVKKKPSYVALDRGTGMEAATESSDKEEMEPLGEDESDDEGNTLNCKICGKMFTRTENLKRHVETVASLFL